MRDLGSRFVDYMRSPSESPAGIGNTGGGEFSTVLPASPWGDDSHLGIVSALYGLADSTDVWVSRDTAMDLSPIAKGRRVLVTNGARLSLKNRRGDAPAPFTMPFLEQPEADRPLSTTLTWTLDALLFHPRTWWIVQKRDFAGWPARGGAKLLSRKDAEIDADGKLVGAWGEKISDTDPTARYRTRDVIQFDAPDGGLLHEAHRTLKRAMILNAAASLAEGNPVPSIILQNESGPVLEGPQIKELLDDWLKARRTYGAGYVGKGIKATPLALADSQLLIDGRKQMDLELARHVGAPAWALDVALEGATLNYSNRSSRAWELIDLFLATYTTPIASRLSMADVTPLGWQTVFDLDELTREDLKTRFETYAIGLDKGFIDQAWIEAQEGQALKLGETA